MNQLPAKNTLTVKEAAAALGVSKHAIYKACDRNEMRLIKLGRTWRIPTSEVNRLLSEGTNN
jgi:excisionase family DNA binding protein